MNECDDKCKTGSRSASSVQWDVYLFVESTRDYIPSNCCSRGWCRFVLCTSEYNWFDLIGPVIYNNLIREINYLSCWWLRSRIRTRIIQCIIGSWSQRERINKNMFWFLWLRFYCRGVCVRNDAEPKSAWCSSMSNFPALLWTVGWKYAYCMISWFGNLITRYVIHYRIVFMIAICSIYNMR